MTKKWLNTIVVLLLVVVQFFSALSTGQAQEAQTITVGTGGDCATILAAITAASTGDTVKLLENIDVTSSVTISKTLTFDTNGFNVTRSNVTSPDATVFTVSGANFTIIGTGTITSTNTTDTTGSAIFIQNDGTLILDGATLGGGYASVYSVGTTTTSANYMMNSGTLTNGIAIVGKLHNTTINGGLITSTGQLSPIEGMNTSGGTITINGGTIDSLDSGEQAIYHPQVGDLIINGGSITGPVGIEIRQGNLTITGDAVINGTAGDAIFMNGAASTTGSLTANISGGTITSTGGYALRETAATTSETTDITITGGKFTGNPASVTFATTAPEILKLTGGAYSTNPADFVYAPNTIDFIDPWWYINAAEAPVMTVHNTTQGTHFSTIQAAVTDAIDEDVIEVDAGTYNEALVINKAITLTGAGDDLSIIDGTDLAAETLVSVPNLTSGALSISGFTFMDDDVLSADFNLVTISECQSPATVSVTDNTFFGTNTFTGTGDPIEDRGLLIQGGSCAHTIKNNVFDNIGSNAILVEKATGPVEIGNNTFLVPNGNPSAAIWSMSYGIESAPNTVTGQHWYHDNIIRAKTDGGTISGGIAFGTAWSAEGWDTRQYGSYLDVLVENNTIEDFTGAGIAVEVDGEHSTFNGVIQNNTITASADLGTGIALSGPVNNTSILSNIVTGAQRGIYLTGTFDQAYYPTDMTIEKNQLAGNVYGLVEIDAANDQDISPNWWGSATGPTIGQIDGNTNYSPWCADAACTTTAPDAGGNIYLSGMINIPGGILIGTPGLKYHLAADTIIQNDSPCFVIEASNTIIVAEPGVKCIPTESSNGIDVAAGLSGITIDGLEIDGTGQMTGDGIHFAGAVYDIVLVDNKIHDLDGYGIEFAGNVSEVVNIQGNIFKANGGLGINNLGANIVGAEYNSWGDVAGPTGTNGVGVSAKVTYEPFTHADLYLVSSGTPWANQVVNGKEITYTVKAHLVNVNAADFYLEYPANLTYVSHTAGNALGIYDAVTHDSATRKLHFIGYSISGNKTGDLALFNVTFRANSTVVDAPLSFSLGNTSGFGMASFESSSNVFANEMVDSSVTIVELPTITSTDIQGYYLTGEQRQFSVVLDNPTDGADYVHVYLDYKLTGAEMDHISLLEYSIDGGTNWLALGVAPGTTYGEDGSGNVVGYFGKMDGSGFPFAPGTSRTFLFRVSFVTREQADVDFPTSYAVSMQLRDANALPASNFLDELTDSMYVYDPATVKVTGDQYYLVDEPGAFSVTIKNPITGKNYVDTVVFDIIIADIEPTDITALSCSMSDYNWDLLSSLEAVDGDIVARIVGDNGFFTVPPTGVNMLITCSVTYATAGIHATSAEMIDVTITREADTERLVSTNTSATAAVYTAPVITATFPTGTHVAGEPVTLPINITNPDGIPGPFSLNFDLPAGTSFTFGGNTYSCTETGCPAIPVTLPITDAELVITFDGGYTGSLGFSLYDTSLEPDDGLLASFSQTDVEVLSTFSVSGTVSMEGRSAREGVQLILTGTPGIYTATSTSSISNNYVFEDVAEGTYTFTTYQPRYLNITADSGKTLTLAGAETLSWLTLVGGNAFWWDSEHNLPDNVIDILDLGVVGLGYTAGIDLHPDADVNFDNLINIQDLAQVAGSYDLQSDDPDGLNFAYPDWQP